MNQGSKIYPSIFEEIEEWPIHKLHQDRKAFVKEIEAFTLRKIMARPPREIAQNIATTIFQEKSRIKNEPWRIDPPNDNQFWNKQRRLLSLDEMDLDASENPEELRNIVKNIVHRYSEEIVGTFNKSTFLFARRFLTAFFNRLLNAAASKNVFKIFGNKHRLAQRLIVRGELESTRELCKKGIVVVVPTHFSNLDSILVGYAMDAIVGLPSFSYGAGLNLFNSGPAAYFMNRLGAYRVDRRKKNPIYLENLKCMSMLSLKRGTNTLFFPGGTRSRSGSLEKELKKGLLGTTVEAQRALYQEGSDKKIFIVPLIIGYNFVLEGQFLAEQYLASTGKEKYLKVSKDLFYSFRAIVKFIWQIFSKNSEIVLNFGKPLDVFGNYVNLDGESLDTKNQVLDTKGYFKSNGVLNSDLQRESEYTGILASKIVERFRCENIVLASHLVAFVGFQMLKNTFPDIDVYRLVRLPDDDIVFPRVHFISAIQDCLGILKKLESEKKVILSEELLDLPEEIMQKGIKNLGVFHTEMPLTISKNGTIVSQNFKLLFYYHNRLDSYNLDKLVKWEKFPTFQLDSEKNIMVK
jgi:glycerol-3-phosphate O-acyltransferase